MSNQPTRPPGPTLDIRGAVDLGALAARRKAEAQALEAPNGAAAGAGQTPAASFVIDATDATFGPEVVQRSATVPVVLDFWATWCEPCKQLTPILEALTKELGGRILLARIDVDANPQLAAAFQVQSIPSVFAVLAGQPVPLFQGAQPEAQVRAVFTELLRVAATNGVSGRLQPEDLVAAAAPAPPAEEEVEEELPPLHQAAYEAIERDDLDGAVSAYQEALTENPADEEARLGLNQVRLLQRTKGVDVTQARAAAAANAADVDAQLLAADLDVLGGHIEDAFARLVDAVRATAAEDRDRVRTHLLELFDVVGPQDPRVAKARVALANALY